MLTPVTGTAGDSPKNSSQSTFMIPPLGRSLNTYMPRILPSNVSASTVSRFLTSSGSNVPLRSRLVSSTTGPLDVCTVLRVLPFRRLPSWRSSSSRCDSISPSKAASRKLFSSGANAPSLPYNDLPERNCSRAFFLISSRLNCSSFFCSITCVKVGDFSGFDTVHFTASLLIKNHIIDYSDDLLLDPLSLLQQLS